MSSKRSKYKETANGKSREIWKIKENTFIKIDCIPILHNKCLYIQIKDYKNNVWSKHQTKKFNDDVTT